MAMAIPFHKSASSYSFPNTWIALLVTLLSFFLLPSSDSVYFQLSRFDPGATSILYDGDAVANVGAIEFNNVNYLSRLIDRELGPQTTRLAGTFGYLAPEYIRTGKASKGSDVYSFGMVALEIATGRKSVDLIDGKYQIGLVEWVWDLYGGGQLVSALDEGLRMDFDAKQVECLMIVGLWCAHPDHSLRPSIRQAIQVLNFDAAVPNLPSKMPVPMYHVPAGTQSTGSGEPMLTNTSIDVGR
ncbi:unnamed protein product [Ilex paraguariensis]|uniref:Protein kinase domain-containing protein n=1 Tax=Ilex paraguariensis TaxID=185542 RepID=A0ABC8S0G8_9AQUA